MMVLSTEASARAVLRRNPSGLTLALAMRKSVIGPIAARAPPMSKEKVESRRRMVCIESSYDRVVEVMPRKNVFGSPNVE